MSSPRQKLIYLFDWPLMVSLLLLFAMGLINLYSATSSGEGDVSPYFISQMQWTFMGLAVMGLALCFHYRRLQNWALPFYGLTLILLVAVFLWGTEVGGQKNWLVLGPLRLQPSELAKLAVILVLSKYYAGLPEGATQQGRVHLKALAWVALPLVLILMEKDLGGGIFLVLISLTYLWLTGLSKRWLLAALIFLTVMGGVGYQFFLKDYQRARIQIFLNPEADPRGKGYHLLQSKIAVGSGQWTGKGYRKGSLHQLQYLPERHTDFVFPVLAEEWGFVGSALFMGLFGLFFLFLFQAAGKMKEPFGALVVAGVGAWLFWQWVLNLGGVLGLLPLAGVTLPFFSYGGSALLTNCLALGLVFNIYMRRYVF